MSALDRIKKLRKQLEEEKTTGKKSELESSLSRINEMKEQIRTTGKIDLPESGPVSPIGFQSNKKSVTETTTPISSKTSELSPVKSFGISYNEDYKGSEEANLATKYRDFRTVGDYDNEISRISGLIRNERKKIDEKLSSEGDGKWWSKNKSIGENLYNLLLDPKGGQGRYEDSEAIKKYTKELEELSKRREQVLYEQESANMSTADKVGYTIAGNLDTGRRGIESTIQKILGQTPDSQPTLNEKLSTAAGEQTEGVGKVGLDVVGSVSRMLPNIILGAGAGAVSASAKIGSAVSTGAGFANFGGGAYNQAKEEGYTEEQATKYGATIGVMEMALTKALGSLSSVYGTSKMGGATQKAINGVMSKVVGNTFVRQSLTSFISEGSEEFLQEYIDNIARDTLLDEKGFLKSTWENITDTQVLEDALYSALIGGITGATMDATQNVDVAVQEKQVIKQVENEMGRKLTRDEKNTIKKELEVVRKYQPTNEETNVPTNEAIEQPTTNEYQTIEEIDNQIATLESQLNENISDEEYNKITNQIKELENQAELIERNGQISPTTTQEVETNSLVDAPSNTLETGNRPVSPVMSGQQTEQLQNEGAFLNEENTQTEEKPRLVNKTFSEQVDEVIEGKYPKKDMLVVSENTPKILQEIGLNDLPITMTQKHLYTMTNKDGKYKNVNYHDIDPEIIKQIPEALERPLNVLQSDTKDDSIVVVTELADKNNDIIVASIKIDGEGRINEIKVDSNVMTSAYGKSNNYDFFMKDNIERGNLLYDIDEGIKKRVIRDRLQLPMQDNSSDKNISQNKDSVKLSETKKSESISPIKSETTSKVQEDLAPLKEATKELKQAQKEVKAQVKELKEQISEFKALTKEQYQEYDKMYQESLSQLNEIVAPTQEQVTNDNLDTASLDDKTVRKITKDFKRGMKLNKVDSQDLDKAIKELSRKGNLEQSDVLEELYNYSETNIRNKNEEIADIKQVLRNVDSLTINQNIASDVDMPYLRSLAKNNLKFKMADRTNVDSLYEELSDSYPHYFPSDIDVPSQQFERLVEVASTPVYNYEKMTIPHDTLIEEADYIYNLIQDYKYAEKVKDSEGSYKELKKSMKGVEAPTIEEELSPVKEEISKEAFTKKIEELSGEIKNELGYIPKDPRKAETYEYDEEVAEILTEEPKTQKDKKNKLGAILKANILDKGMVFEDLSIKNKNRKLQAKWDYTLTSESRGQYIIGNGHIDEMGNQTSKSLNAIMEEVNNTGLTKEFYEYMYHKHNVDRMNLETKAKAKSIELDKQLATITDKNERSEIEAQLKELSKVTNKPVFGFGVTSELSQQKVNEIEMEHPEFMDFAQDVYDYVNADREQLVKEGVISQETADLWQEMYPHYVPIRRADHTGNAINVALDTNRTGINAPIKKATGGNSDILPLFDTMAQRTIQTQRATAKNSFGIELKNTLKAKGIKNNTNLDEVIDSVDNQEELLQEGKNGASPTFTVFQNGERVTYEITEEMYEALKPISDSSILSKTFKPTNIASNIHRGLLTQYNIFFALKNGIKDIQDVLLNSQHAVKTYAKIPEAYAQLLGKGHWYNEYMRNGGEQNSYFDSQEMNFDTQHKGISKVLDFWPIKKVAQLNDFIERVPRLAEYIASREAGRSIEESMLDAARVTTNFKAGGNVTKWANRNFATFLNASVQGALQQVRNVREANMNGFKGWAGLATKFAMAGLPAMLLNALLWDDDEEYEELSDYVKQNYYIVGKYGDGQFIRIPKGRTVAVIQDAIEQVSNAATGNDEVDMASFLQLVTTNLAPSNPLDNNIFAPIGQALANKTWYGDDLVPSRLKDLPAEEQFDETTDTFSRWLGEKTGISPIKINYLLNQYSGVVGDLVMPSITPKATQDSENTLLAPLRDIFTVDGVMKNQNVSDFYSTSEKLTTGAKSKNATDEDILKNKYINSVKTELNDLYAQKREIQSDLSLSKSEKYKQVKEVQKQINEITKDALSKYSEGNYTDNYGIIDDREYYKDEEGDWNAVNKDERIALNEMGLSLSEKSEYVTIKQDLDNIKDEYVGKGDDYSNEKEKRIIETITSTNLSEEAQVKLYKRYYNSDKIDKVMKVNIGSSVYFDYVQQEFKADYNAKGNAISGSRKNKVINYVNEYDLDIPQKAILIKYTNTFKFNDYNYEIVDYVANLGITYEEKRQILEDLDMKVYDDGTVEWE